MDYVGYSPKFPLENRLIFVKAMIMAKYWQNSLVENRGRADPSRRLLSRLQRSSRR